MAPDNILYESLTRDLKAVAFDLDGTIYLGNRIIDDAAEVVSFLKKKGIKVFYFTNNSSKTRLDVFQKLSAMGLELSVSDIYTSAYASANYAYENSFSDVYYIGTDGLRYELEAKGINTTEDNTKVKAIIIGMDTDFNYGKLAKVMNFRDSDCRIIVCNKDRSFPVENGKLMPGCGPIAAAIEEFLGKKSDYMTGKPHTYMIELLAKDANLKNSDILVVGDSYESDIEMAKRFRCRSVLISKERAIGDTVTVTGIKDIKALFAS